MIAPGTDIDLAVRLGGVVVVAQLSSVFCGRPFTWPRPRCGCGGDRGICGSLPAMGFIDDELTVLELGKLPVDSWVLIDQISDGTYALFQKVVARFGLLNAEPVDELPANLVDWARQAIRSVADSVPDPAALTATNRELHGIVTQFRSQLNTAWEWWANNGRMHVRATDIARASEEFDLRREVENARQARQEIEEIRTSLVEVANVAGTLRLAQHYEEQSARYRKNAQWALVAVLVLSVMLIGGGWWFIHTIPPTTEWTTLARDALSRAFAIGAVSYGIAFSARIYRTNTHLQAIYEQKTSALKTFNLFSSTVDDDEARILILGELVRSVFASAATGVFEKDSDHTVIENAVPIATALSRAR
jgi:hypothetical protein